MGKTGKTPAHVSQKHELQSRRQHGAAGGERLIPPGFTSVDTPGVPLLPTQLFLSVVLSLSLSAPSIHPCVQQLTGADPPADQLPQHVGARPVVLCFFVLLTSFPPAQETKEERKQETLAPPSLHSQAARASARSSSPSFSLNAVRTGMVEDQLRRGGRGGVGQ